MVNAKNELLPKEKQEAASGTERLEPGRYYTPSVDIFDDRHSIMLSADMPGVKPDALTIDLHDHVLTLAGNVVETDHSGEEVLVQEYGTGRFFRQFELSDLIDQEKIKAELAHGVLRLTLPKVEPAKPRRIKIQGG